MFGKKKKRKMSLEEIIKENEGLVCENCRTPIPGNLNLCPNCGLNPGTQTMTDIYKPGSVKQRDQGEEK